MIQILLKLELEPASLKIRRTEEKIKIAIRKRSKPGKGSGHDNICSKDLHLLKEARQKG